MSTKTKIYSTIEAIELLNQGKKIASQFSTDNSFLVKNNSSGIIMSSKGYACNSSVHMFKCYYSNALWVEYFPLNRKQINK